MSLLERNQAIAARIANPAPIAERLRQLFLESKRRQLLAGTDAQGVPFQPLAASTLKYHKGSPTPLVPAGNSSKIIARMEIAATPENGGVRIKLRWPTLTWVKYHVNGGRRLPQRDPTGFAEDTKREGARIMKDWVMRG